MARPISDEELQLKRRARRRLVGAVVLVAAIVVALPWVLEPGPIEGDVNISIPSPDSSKFTSRMVPVPPSAEPRSASREAVHPDSKATPKLAAAMGERAPTGEPEGAKASVAAPAPKTAPPAVADASAKSVAPAPAAVESARPAPAATTRESGGQTYSVQVAALADAVKVKQVQEQMTAAGLKSYTETVKTARGEVTRVRAGPYADRASAEKAHDQLKTLGLSGNIVAQ